MSALDEKRRKRTALSYLIDISRIIFLPLQFTYLLAWLPRRMLMTENAIVAVASCDCKNERSLIRK